MSWQPTDPIALLTRPIEQLQKLATQAGIPYTDGQILEKGLTMIRSTRDFEYALIQWENKPNFSNYLGWRNCDVYPSLVYVLFSRSIGQET